VTSTNNGAARRDVLVASQRWPLPAEVLRTVRGLLHHVTHINEASHITSLDVTQSRTLLRRMAEVDPPELPAGLGRRGELAEDLLPRGDASIGRSILCRLRRGGSRDRVRQ
jgi:hypothetical protein